ncbi:MAG TPA: DUF2851 family protein [Bacteroidia bacterium]|nr:DUF2851 family protein [Bacteroidia bacterium]
MNEAFLHYLWQYRLFDSRNLITSEGSRVEVIRPGKLNSDAGPDFFNAQLRIDGTLWAGNVEIHIHASDWQKHGHHFDPAYDNCILHVVFEKDMAALRKDGTAVPTIELKDKFPAHLWANYLQLLGTRGWVACEHRLKETDSITIHGWLDRLGVERLEEKTKQIRQFLYWSRNDWEETFYQHLAKNFGFRVNALPFELLSRSLPLRLIQKHRTRLQEVEALLFGQAGMLSQEFHDNYPISLATEYRHLCKVYNLKPIHASAWKFLRLRPSNFPTIRIAQFAQLLKSRENLFSRVLQFDSIQDGHDLFKINTSDYWINHFLFDKPADVMVKGMGRSSAENIMINTVVPFLFAWGKEQGSEAHRKKALDLLEKIPSEDNHLIRNWKEAGIPSLSAFHSQALIQLKLQYCSEKKCLSCAIGNRLINSLP